MLPEQRISGKTKGDIMRRIREKLVVHRFLDEAGDTTIFGKGKIIRLGQPGVSSTFILGMVKFREPLAPIRGEIIQLQKKIEADPYFLEVPSIRKKQIAGGYYFHATDDIPEVRKEFYDFIKSKDCSFEAIVGRKIASIFINKHNGNEAEFYADLLSHLLKNKLGQDQHMILNIAEKGSSTRHNNLQSALNKANMRFSKKAADREAKTIVTFNVQKYTLEPLLTVADYFCWAIQRVFEKGEIRYYNFMFDKISLVVDLYDAERWHGSKNYYRKGNPLTAQNKTSP